MTENELNCLHVERRRQGLNLCQAAKSYSCHRSRRSQRESENAEETIHTDVTDGILCILTFNT